MKIGIVTLYGKSNYGNRLQNYALQKLITNRNHSVVTIEGDSENWLRRVKNTFFRYSKNHNQPKSIRDILREYAFARFTKKYIPTKFFHTKTGRIPDSVNASFDMFFVGSDQVWNPLFWKGRVEPYALYNYFLVFSQKSTAAYAASFGLDAIPEPWMSRMAPLIQKLDFVSVREESALEITKQFGVDAQLVLDPTLLLPAEEWRAIESNVVTEGKYVLTYFLGTQPQYVIEQVNKKAEQLHAEVINLYDVQSKYYTYGPETFLELIDKAEVVFTDSFHAAVFSILFHKEFAVFKRNHANQSDMSSRIKTLLESVGIENGISGEEIILHNDFGKYDEMLEARINISLFFLEKALGQVSSEDIF